MLPVLRDRYLIPFKDSPPPPDTFPTYQAGSPLSLALRQEVEKMLSKDALEIVLDPGPSFYSRLSLASHDQSLSPERVCSANSIQDGDSSLRASVHPRGEFPSFHRSEGCVFPDIRSSVVEEAIEVPVGGVYQFKALWFGLSTAPQVFTRVFATVSAWAHSHGIHLLRYLDDWLVLASWRRRPKRMSRICSHFVTSPG